MLAITDDAADAIRTLTGESGEGGLRISVRQQRDDSGSTELAVALAGGSEPGDQVVAEKGCRVFIQEQVASLLADKTLDAARLAEEKAIQFRIRGGAPDAAQDGSG